MALEDNLHSGNGFRSQHHDNRKNQGRENDLFLKRFTVNDHGEKEDRDVHEFSYSL